MSEELKETPPKKSPRNKTKQFCLYNKLSQDVFIGTGYDTICLPPRAKVFLDESLVPAELPVGVIITEIK